MTSRKPTNPRRKLTLLGVTLLCLLLALVVAAVESEFEPLSFRVGTRWNKKAKEQLAKSGVRPFECSYSGSCRLWLFDLDVEHEADMNKGVLTDELRAAFADGIERQVEEKWQLSENATIKVVGRGPVWLLTDEENRLRFFIERGKDFQDEKKEVLRVSPSSPFRTTSYWTLPNGLSMRIDADKSCEEDPLKVQGLAFANSTMLFACKGESWHPASGVELAGKRCRLDKVTTWKPGPKDNSKTPPEPVYLWKGMEDAAAVEALKSAKLEKLPMDGKWTEQFPKSGQWHRYSLGEERELAINLDSRGDDCPPLVRWIIVDAAKPAGSDGDPKRYRIECELLDLKSPLREDWHWAFDEKWSWDPDNPDRVRRLRAAGQRR